MPESRQYSDQRVYTTLTIANGQTLSDAADLHGTSLVGFYMPAAWTAANITYKASQDNITFADIYDGSGNVKTSTVGASQFIPLDLSNFLGVRYLKLLSSASQGAARAITLVSRMA